MRSLVPWELKHFFGFLKLSHSKHSILYMVLETAYDFIFCPTLKALTENEIAGALWTPSKVFVRLKLSHFRIIFFFIIFLYGFGNCLWFYYWVFSRRNTIYKRIRLLLPCEFHRQLGHIIFYMVLGSSYYLFLNFSPLEIQFVYLFNFCKREWGCQRLLSSINNWLGSRRIDMSHMICNWTWVERITFLLLTVLSFLDPFDYIYIYIHTHTILFYLPSYLDPCKNLVNMTFSLLTDRKSVV